MAKRLLKGVDIYKLSARPADPYGARFMKFMRDTVFELDDTAQKEAQLDIDKMKAELVEALKKSLADMIKNAFMKKDKGKISLSNFKEKQPATVEEPVTMEPENKGDSITTDLDELAQSQVSLFSDAP